ncbi:MAG TPA: zinc ribbon domain-containing protein, partial [Phototrophicaceae bacterium]|nr:zinc ribbon domain-containing protein [Phototrophicaceae bacterium]
ACPNCHTRLKRPCTRCGRMLDLSWDLCPYCATAVPNFTADRPVHQHSRQSSPTPEAYASNYGVRAARQSSGQSEALEFVDNDEN